MAKNVTGNFDRWRFKTTAVDDYRPVRFNPKYPWWCSGYGEDERGEYAIIIAYLPVGELIKDYWPEYFDADLTSIAPKPVFTDRFYKPVWYVE